MPIGDPNNLFRATQLNPQPDPQPGDRVKGGQVWKPTNQLRWVSWPRNPDKLVLQQMWHGNYGERTWEDVPHLILDDDDPGCEA